MSDACECNHSDNIISHQHLDKKESLLLICSFLSCGCRFDRSAKAVHPVSANRQKIAKLQALVDLLRKDEQLRQYVEDHTLCLYDSRLIVVDMLLDEGILR